MTYKALIIIAAVLLMSGCETMQQTYDFAKSKCDYEKTEGKRVLACAL